MLTRFRSSSGKEWAATMASLITEDLSQPGTHALVIGVSAYEFLLGSQNCSSQGQEFGIGQLSAAARSASEFAAWLMEDYSRSSLPLRSLRVLLSPSPDETIAPSIHALLKGNWKATRQNVEAMFSEFRDAAASHEDNIAIVYVVGHGVQFSKNGAVLLLNDFADPQHRYATYTGAVDMKMMHDAMNHEETAQTQFWFVDVCRDVPADVERYDVLAGVMGGNVSRAGSAKTSPLFLSASSGQGAFASKDKLTLFCDALMSGLKEGHAARSEGERNSPWRVSVNTLVEYLPAAVQSLANAAGEVQQVECTGRITNAIFHECSKPPDVDLTISIRSGFNSANYTANLKHRGALLYANHSAWPLTARVRAGLYTIEVTTLTPPDKDEDCLNLQPPSNEKVLPL
jgi:hypothetical protein